METTTLEETKEVATIKPGYRTTEFWLTVFANIVGGFLLIYCEAADVVGDMGEACKMAGVASIVLSNMGYSISRAIVKKG